MDEETLRLLLHMVRVGTVSSVNAGKRTARVIIPGLDEMVTGELKVLRHTNNSGDCWLPQVGSQVLCIYIPKKDAAGFIVGGI